MELYYKTSNDDWQPVSNTDSYTVKKGVANEMFFDAVTTTAVKLEIIQPDEHSAGLFEWEVK